MGGSWFVENVLEELDQKNEWYFDAEKHMLYLWPNKTSGPPSETLVATRLKTLIEIVGDSQDSPVKGVSIQGVGFRDAAYTYMDDWGVPSGGDWSLHRGGAVFLERTEEVSVSNCSFQRVDGNALFLSMYNRHTSIDNNEFAWIGDSAMAAWGNTHENDGTGGDQPRETSITRNFVHEIGIYEKQSSFWFQAKTCQTFIDKNIAFNGPRAMINFNDGFGGGNNVSHSLIFNTCRESGDHGPINSWDRQPFITKVKYGYPSYDAAITSTFENFIIANYGGSQSFDNDDGSSWYSSFKNFFYSADGFKMDYGGHDSNFHDNLIVTLPYDGQNCINTWPFKKGHGDQFWENHCIIAGARRPDQLDQVSEYAECSANDPVVTKNNHYYTISGKINFSCGGVKGISLETMQQKYGMEVGSTAAVVPSTDWIIKKAREILNMY